MVADVVMLVIGNPSSAASSPTSLLGTTYVDANLVRPALVLGGWGLLRCS